MVEGDQMKRTLGNSHAELTELAQFLQQLFNGDSKTDRIRFMLLTYVPSENEDGEQQFRTIGNGDFAEALPALEHILRHYGGALKPHKGMH
jgi:hypothetical protein